MGQHTNQIYDYKGAYDISFQSIGEFSQKPVVFSNWAMYPIYLKFINELFCANELTGITFNALFVSSVASMLYSILKDFMAPRTAILASLIFAAWPSFLEYIPMLSPEFVFVFLATLSGFIICRTYKSKNTAKKYAGYISATVILAFANFFKSVVPIILISATATFVLLLIDKRKDVFNYLKIQSLKHIIATAVLAVSAFILTTEGCYFGLSTFYGSPVNRSAQSYYMSVGLSCEAKGFFNSDILNEYYQMMVETDYNFEEVNRIFTDKLFDDIKNNNHIDFEFVKNKLRYSFGNDDYTGMINMTINPEYSIVAQMNWVDYFAPFNQMWYIICIIMIIISSIRNVFTQNDKKVIFYSALTIFGFVLLILLSEAQPRYKCVFYPLFAILVADGVDGIVAFYNFLRKKHSNKSDKLC